LELAIRRRSTRKPLATIDIDEKIVERFYQTRAIRRVGEAFEQDQLRRALLVMATGSGKTRTVIALSDQLMRANWARRILFLADPQGAGEPGCRRLPQVYARYGPGEPAHRQDRHGPGLRLHLPDHDGPDRWQDGGERRFGPGHFDLIVIDERTARSTASTARSSTGSTACWWA
jgi:type I restriction enzyme R subunit